VTVVIGVDPHKQTHTAVAVRSGTGEVVDELTATARVAGHEDLLRWAQSLSADRLWALEDVRSVSRGLERLLVARGERVVRVPPKLMAGARRGARSFGKSDSIDALAIARAALGHPDLPVARSGLIASNGVSLEQRRASRCGSRRISWPAVAR
jgi:transposase